MPLTPPHEELWHAHSAWRRTTLSVWLTILGMPFELVVARGIPGISPWPSIINVAFAAVLFGVLLARARRPSLRVAAIIFLLDALGLTVALWFIQRDYAHSGVPWAPFQENKLAMLTVALMAPELWVGLLSILLYAASAILHTMMFPPAIYARLAVGEPLATIVIAVMSTILLVYSLRRLAIEARVASAIAEKRAMQRLARTLLAVRDLANTPLQTITLASALARQKHADLGPVLDPIDHALDRMRELDLKLRAYEHMIEWKPGDGSSA